MLNAAHIGERIATLRKKQSLTQSKLADLLMISPQAVSSWERGETMPDTAKLSDITGIFGISVDQLLNHVPIATIGAAHTKEKMFDEIKMYTYLKGYANCKGLLETQKALVFAREKHKHQSRKEGTPYIIHPLTMACNALALGINDDNTIATILLHDVCEDCEVEASELPMNETIKNAVKAITFSIQEGESKERAKKRYFHTIINSREATIAKIIDRCHNVSSMARVFSKKKLRLYIGETKEYVLPLIREAKNRYPDMADNFFILKYHICSVINSIEAVMDIYEEESRDTGR